MPRVTAYGPRRVAPAPLPNARRTNTATAESFGAGLGEVAANIGIRGLGAQWQAEREKADEVALMDFDRQTGEWERSHLHDAQTGVLNTVKGKDALDLSRTVGEEYDKFSGQLLEGLSERQRTSAQKLSLRRRSGILSNLDGYASHEMARYENDVTEASLSNSVSLAIANAGDLPRVGEELQRQKMIIDGYAAHQGIPPEKRDAMLLKARTDVHTGVIEHYLNSEQDGAAKAYFEEAKGQIDGAVHAQIEKAIEVGSLRGASQRRSDAILASTTTATDALEQVRAIEDPKLRDETQQRVEHALTLRSALQRDADEAKLRGVYDVLDKTRNVKSIPPSVWATMSGSERSSARSYAKSLIEGAGGVKTDPAELYTLLTLSSTDPDAFLKTNLLRYRTQLSSGDLEQMMRKQAEMRSGKPSTTLFASEGIQNEAIDAGIRAIGLDPSPPERGSKGYDKSISDRVMALRRTVREAVDREFPPSAGKKPTRADVQSVVDTLIAPTQPFVDGWFSDTPAKYAFETDRAKVTRAADVPQGERQQIVDALRRAGVAAPSDAMIVDVFNRQLARVRGDR